ncbi:hypothetical protein D3C78_1709920 [compost metagenome]
MRQTHVCGRFHTHVAQIVSRVATVFGLAATAQVLEYGITGERLGRHFVTGFVNVVEFDPAAVDQFLGEFA